MLIYPAQVCFLTDKFHLGLSLPILYSEKLSFGISPFATYYFNSEGSKSISNLKYRHYPLLEDVDIINVGVTGNIIEISPGYMWFLNEIIGLYSKLIVKVNTDGIGMGMHFGFKCFLDR